MTAIVTDVNYRMSLALIRDLHDKNINVIAAFCGDNIPFAAFSKGVCRCERLPDVASAPEAYIDALHSLCQREAEKGARPVLIPVGAKTLGLLAQSAASARFENVCHTLISGSATLDLANDKKALAALAQKLDIPVPKSYDIVDPADFNALEYPLVIKPICGEKQGLSAEKRYAIVHDGAAAKAAFSRFTFDGNRPLVQEYLSGGALGYSVLAKEGEIVNSICHARVREYPLSGGPSTCCKTVDGGLLHNYSQKLIKSLNFSGLCMIEYKLDRNNIPHLLEINPRIWGTYPLTRAAKSSMSYDYFALAAGLPPEKKAAKLGQTMFFLPSDINRGLACLKRGKFGGFFAPFGAIFNPKAREGVFEWGDFSPSIKYLSSYFKRQKENG